MKDAPSDEGIALEWTGLLLAVSLAAPLPRPAGPPDPLGRGFMGVYPVSSSLVIDRVEPGSPAARSGLRPGDRFLTVGSLEPKTFDELRAFVMDFRPGTKVNVSIRRDNATITRTIQLGIRSESTGYPIFPIDNEP